MRGDCHSQTHSPSLENQLSQVAGLVRAAPHCHFVEHEKATSQAPNGLLKKVLRECVRIIANRRHDTASTGALPRELHVTQSSLKLVSPRNDVEILERVQNKYSRFSGFNEVLKCIRLAHLTLADKERELGL